MRIGIDGEVFIGNRNGVRRYAISLLEHLLKIDHENEYVIYLHKLANTHFFHGDNCRIKVVNLPRLVWKSFIFTYLLDKDKIDIFHSPAYSLPLVPKFLRKVKLVTTFHGLHWEYCRWPLREKIPWILLFRSSAKVADAIISVSETQKKEIYEKYNIHTSKIYVVYPGISQNFKPLKESEKLLCHRRLTIKYGIPSKFCIYPGAGLRPNKNLITLLRAWKILSENYSIEIPLVVRFSSLIIMYAFSAHSYGLRGFSTNNAALLTTSGIAEAFETITGVPQAIDSSGGEPKPSYIDGYTENKAQEYKQGMSFSSTHSR
ncbi:MAG: glycosyltransferase, partial [Thermoproteota archaeon]